ncbi:MAG: hypothetical protein HYU64_01650 [Armatimonadetes bacterium]|nr:hypothetical protein [Armatimonadota bacterium]
MIRSTTSPAPKDWTVLYYLAGNNNIADDMIKKMARLEQVGSTEQMDVVVQMGQPESGPFPGTTRFHVEKNPNPVRVRPEPVPPIPLKEAPSKRKEPLPQIYSKPVMNLGPMDMSQPSALQDFIEWGMKSYPAKHYFVVLMDHGYGFVGTIDDAVTHRSMSFPELSRTLSNVSEKTGKKLDVVGFDSCLIAQAEIADELAGTASYMVASEEVEYPLGWPEGNVMGALAKRLEKGSVSARQAARLAVKETAKDPAIKTMSAVDLSRLKPLHRALDRLAEALMKSELPKETLVKIVQETHNYCTVIPDETLCTDYRDLYDFARKLLSSPEVSDPAVRRAAFAVTSAVRLAVVAEAHPNEEAEGSHGLSIYLPTRGLLTNYDKSLTKNPHEHDSEALREGMTDRASLPEFRLWGRVYGDGRQKETNTVVNPKAIYKELKFAQSTLWDEFLEKLGG